MNLPPVLLSVSQPAVAPLRIVRDPEQAQTELQRLSSRTTQTQQGEARARVETILAAVRDRGDAAVPDPFTKWTTTRKLSFAVKNMVRRRAKCCTTPCNSDITSAIRPYFRRFRSMHSILEQDRRHGKERCRKESAVPRAFRRLSMVHMLECLHCGRCSRCLLPG